MIKSSQVTKRESKKESRIKSGLKSENELGNETGEIMSQQSDQIGYGIQVALMSLGGILGIISAILIITFLFFGDLIRMIL
ncbi:MAG: hypothetical protein GX217_06360 [Clostridiaceae bacterium]|nr:hypothetical protein [Clostridiaceae bacterium]